MRMADEKEDPPRPPPEEVTGPREVRKPKPARDARTAMSGSLAHGTVPAPPCTTCARCREELVAGAHYCIMCQFPIAEEAPARPAPIMAPAPAPPVAPVSAGAPASPPPSSTPIAGASSVGAPVHLRADVPGGRVELSYTPGGASPAPVPQPSAPQSQKDGGYVKGAGPVPVRERQGTVMRDLEKNGWQYYAAISFMLVVMGALLVVAVAIKYRDKDVRPPPASTPNLPRIVVTVPSADASTD